MTETITTGFKESEVERAYPRMERRSVEDLLGMKYPGNPHVATPEGMALLDQQIDALGNVQPITFNIRTGRILSGNKRIELYAKRGDEFTDVWVVDLPEEKERVAVIALNNHAGDFDAANLKILTEAIAASDMDWLALTGFRPGELESILATMDNSATGKENQRQQAHKTLASRFIIPPFSVLDARQGYWQERKAAWIALGLKGEEGRGKNLLKFSDTVLAGSGRPPQPGRGQRQSGPNSAWIGRKDGQAGPATAFDTEGNIAGDWTGTSIFDPVLCEAVYHWFCPKNGSVLDPFAGGVTRGAVAACTGHPYVGCDLSAAQIEANRKQWPDIKAPAVSSTADGVVEPPVPQWIEGDSRELTELTKGENFDLIFSCPPYAFLERYSDDERDISTLPYDMFRAAYWEIINSAVKRLKPNRFAVFVVGEVRDPKTGFYVNLVQDTIYAFADAGAEFYNEIILVTAVGSLPIRVGRAFDSARKVGKTHQNVLVFFKGDPAKIKDEFPTDIEAPVSTLDALVASAQEDEGAEGFTAVPEVMPIGGEI